MAELTYDKLLEAKAFMEGTAPPTYHNWVYQVEAAGIKVSDNVKEKWVKK